MDLDLFLEVIDVPRDEIDVVDAIRVIVESHPRIIGRRCMKYNEMVEGSYGSPWVWRPSTRAFFLD